MAQLRRISIYGTARVEAVLSRYSTGTKSAPDVSKDSTTDAAMRYTPVAAPQEGFPELLNSELWMILWGASIKRPNPMK